MRVWDWDPILSMFSLSEDSIVPKTKPCQRKWCAVLMLFGHFLCCIRFRLFPVQLLLMLFNFFIELLEKAAFNEELLFHCFDLRYSLLVARIRLCSSLWLLWGHCLPTKPLRVRLFHELDFLLQRLVSELPPLVRISLHVHFGLLLLFLSKAFHC